MYDNIPRLNVCVSTVITPTISTTAYTAEDQVGGIMTLNQGQGIIRINDQVGYGTCNLAQVTILDKAKQKAAFDLFFFNASATTVADNAAYSLTDAEFVAKCVGVVSVGSTYQDSALNSISCDRNINLRLFASTGNALYCIAKTTGTPTYGSTSDLQFQFVFDVD